MQIEYLQDFMELFVSHVIVPSYVMVLLTRLKVQVIEGHIILV